MGILGKFKNIFYDTIEEDEEIEVKPKQEEIKKPKIEEIKFDNKVEEVTTNIKRNEEVIKTDNTFSERKLFKPERTFNFTEFDDEDEIKPRVNVMELERQNRNNSFRNVNTGNVRSSYDTKPEVAKVFKPSPVISPIYGILDKDYKKEEVKEKSNVTESISSYDSVRQKAYGNSEVSNKDAVIKVQTTDITATLKEINDDVDKLNKTTKLEELISEIEKNAEMTVGEIEDKAISNNYDKEEKDYNDRTMTSNTLEHDLFNLIDSMYDDKED